MIKPIKIGNTLLPNNAFLAPMAGITDKSFRQICQEMGCGLTYSEMVSAKSIMYGNALNLMDKTEFSSQTKAPWAVQLFGRDPIIMADIVRKLMEESVADIIDINMGCPAPKIVKNGEGSALMKEPLLVGEIVAALVKAASAFGKPVTVKIRKGFNNECLNAVEIAKIAEDSGASAVTVHGRTREQFYSGTADWDAIAAVKAAVKTIPVIANGDVVSKDTAMAILEHTKCDGLMIGRAACGNPWLFKQILKDAPLPEWEEKRELAMRHARMLIQHKGEHVAVLEMRKHLSWYIKGLQSATKLRTHINKATSYGELEHICQNM